MRETLTKAKELPIKQEPDDAFSSDSRGQVYIIEYRLIRRTEFLMCADNLIREIAQSIDLHYNTYLIIYT